MAFNGDGPHSKKPRTDNDSGAAAAAATSNRGHSVNYTNMDEPRRKRQEDSKPNHVLLFTVINPMYPITVDVLHTICQTSGQVLRIVIFKKNGVQAMVEFDTLESAIRAKDSLNGADIYSGCCTLKIDFAKPEKLNVHKNDSESWDYTISLMKENTNGRPQPLLQEPHYGSRPQPYSSPNYNEAPTPYNNSDTYRKNPPAPTPTATVAAVQTTPEFREHQRNTPFQQPGAVLMVYGLDPVRTNADKLFNLMCLYGNVSRIKFLKSKEGTAMVQMGDNVAVERCVQNLNNVTVGLTGAEPIITHPSHHQYHNQSAMNNNNTSCNSNSSSKENSSSANNNSSSQHQQCEHRLQLAFSKQQYLSEVTNPYPLPDKSPSYKEYTTNKNNRFTSPAMASKNRIQPPSKILHFFNTPPQVTEDEIMQVFQDYDVILPKAIKLFPMKSERSSSGLLEFDSTTDAVAAVMACNHAAIDSPGTKFPFIMKLCFSSSRNMSIRNGDNSNGPTADKRMDSDH